ncbi:hypothetical protein [Streptomyces roseoverticillatus]|uniref:Integral membrane protein n=1 Tax=Streptomyces roseoverticillatus TaxID=66429 RepID=A0ABV3J1P6_9ACTN
MTALSERPAPITARQRADLTIALTAWAVPLLLTTAVAPATSRPAQLALMLAGALTVTLMLRREDRTVRGQTLAATLCACTVEALAVPVLHLWTFWRDAWPLWLPFHHAQLYLTTVVIARSLPGVLRHPVLTPCAVLWCGAATVWRVLAGERGDLISVFGVAALLSLRRHPVLGPRLPTIVVVCGLTDAAGVAAGTWTYQPHDITGLLTLGNPPAAVAGGFCITYYASLLLAPRLLNIWQRLGGGPPVRKPAA